MKFRKRMLVMLVAAVMLVAGSLSYFAFAADVEPYAVAIRCPSCANGSCTEGYLRCTSPSGLTSHRLDDGTICYYQYDTDEYGLSCDSCSYTRTTSTKTHYFGHQCGMGASYS